MNRRRLALLGAAVLAAAMLAGAQEAPVQIDISAQELLSGGADQRLEELGARAAAGDLAVTVSAPAYWRDRIVSALKAGAGEAELELTYRETIVENVLVRLSSKTETPIAPDAAPADSGTQTGPAPPAPEADTSELDQAAARLKEQAREMVISEADIPSTAELLAGTTRPRRSPPPTAGRELGPGPETADPAQDPSLEPDSPTPQKRLEVPGGTDDGPTGGGEPDAPVGPTGPADAVERAPEDHTAEARASLSRRLNDGRPIERRLRPTQLRPRDLLFTTGDVIAVVRRSAVGLEVYWLAGELDLQQSALRRLEPGKYRVLRRIRGRSDPEPEAQPKAVAAEPPVGPDARRAMEIRYNEGRAVEATVSPAGLRADDVLLVGDGEIMVVRRDRVGMKRYWLEGPLDLDREELEPTGTRKYRVQRVIRD